MKTVKKYCIYCKDELPNTNDSEPQYHQECFNQVKKYNADGTVIPFAGYMILRKEFNWLVDLKGERFQTRPNPKEIATLYNHVITLRHYFETEITLDVITNLQELQFLALVAATKSDKHLIFKVPYAFEKLQKLQCLSLRDMNIDDPEEVLGKLPNLNIITLINNELKKIPKFVYQLQNVRKLEIVNSKNIMTIPLAVYTLRNLSTLIINSCSIDYIRKDIGKLTHLKKLSLSSNHIVKIPPEIENLQELLILDLSWNYLPELPEEMFLLKKLRVLNICGNPLTALSEKLLTMKHLKKVIIPKLPDEQSQSIIKMLQEKNVEINK